MRWSFLCTPSLVPHTPVYYLPPTLSTLTCGLELTDMNFEKEHNTVDLSTSAAGKHASADQPSPLEKDNAHIQNVLSALNLENSIESSPVSGGSLVSGSKDSSIYRRALSGQESSYPEAASLVQSSSEKPMSLADDDELERLVFDLRTPSTYGSPMEAEPQQGGSAFSSLFSAREDPLIPFYYKRHRIVQELYQTEKVYLSSLRVLLEVYVKPISADYLNAIPVMGFQAVLEELIRSHSSFLWDLKSLFATKGGFDVDISPVSISSNYEFYRSQKANDVFGSSAFIMPLVELISKQSTPAYLYVEYCSRQSKFASFTRGLSMSKYGARLWNLAEKIEYLGGPKMQEKNLDMSFISLIQKPLVRSGKYRLILESLRSAFEAAPDATPTVLDSIDYAILILKRKLDQINENLIENMNRSEQVSRIFAMDERNKMILNQHFKTPSAQDEQIEVDSRVFGDPILCGSADCFWMQGKGAVVQQPLAVLLFKSHVVLMSSRGKVRFIIPLATAKLIEGAPEFSMGGLTLTSEGVIPRSFKLIFERKYCLYEVMFVCCSFLESAVWKYYFDLIIVQVNGGYNLDYSYSALCARTGFKPFFYNPPKLSPLSLCDRVFDPKRYESHKNCYFSYVFPLHILEAESRNAEVRPGTRLTKLKLDEIHSINLLLGPLRSQEFPAPVRTLRRANRVADLGSLMRSSPSWASLRLTGLSHSFSMIDLSNNSVVSEKANSDMASKGSVRNLRKTLSRSQSLRDMFKNVFNRQK